MSELEEGNALILNSPFSDTGNMAVEFVKEKGWNNNNKALSSLKYQSSWDWLMPVMEKIESYRFDDNDGTEEIYNYAHLRSFQKNMVRINRFSLHQEKTKLLATWKAAVEFIKWFNEKQGGKNEY